MHVQVRGDAPAADGLTLAAAALEPGRDHRGRRHPPRPWAIKLLGRTLLSDGAVAESCIGRQSSGFAEPVSGRGSAVLACCTRNGFHVRTHENQRPKVASRENLQPVM